MTFRQAVWCARDKHAKYVYLASTSQGHFALDKNETHYPIICRVYVHNKILSAAIWSPYDNE